MDYDNSTAVPLDLPNKTRILVEATPVRHPGDTDVAFSEMKEALTIESIQGAIEGISEMVVHALEKLAPRKIAAEFALEVGLESGKLTALWVKGSGKANLKITLEWSGADGADSAK
jgi:Trypsin-co-occurring domain 1